MKQVNKNEILRQIEHFAYSRDLGIKLISDEEYDLIDESRDLVFRLRLNGYNEIAVSIETPMSSIVEFDSLDAFELSKIAMFTIKDNQLKISAYRFKEANDAFNLIDKLIKIYEELKMKRNKERM